MQIAIDASRAVTARATGTEHYARELIGHLITLNDRHHLNLYFRSPPPPELFPQSEHVTYHILPFPRLWTHLRFAAEIWRSRPDVTFVPAHTLPAAFPGRAVVTVHDLGYRYFPEAHPTQQRLYLDWTTRYSAHRAHLVLADSRATANDLTRFYGTPPQKIRVVYPGVEPPPLRSVDVRQKYGLPPRYFLFIGTLQPRKNIARIIEAFNQWQQANPDTGTGLVLAGKPGWLFDSAWVEGVENVMMTGYIDEADKGALLSHALALVFPTLYEGFGFPVLEAMHCDTPVIASTTSSLPELVGDAGIQVNPLDVAEIAAALERIQRDDLRHQLIERGKKQAQRFTWEQAASDTMQVLEDAAR